RDALRAAHASHVSPPPPSPDPPPVLVADALAAVTRLGGMVERDWNSPGEPPVGVSFHIKKDLRDEDLVCLRAFPSPRKLCLFGGPGITSKALTYVRHLPLLEELELYESQVDDEGLAQLRGLGHLRVLKLGNTCVTDAGLPAVLDLPALRQ